MGATIYNAAIIKTLIDKCKLQPSKDVVPQELAEKVLPVVEVSPERKIHIAREASADSASEILHTCHASKKTFLINCQLSVSKDVLSDSTNSFIDLIPVGAARLIVLEHRYEPLTVGAFFAHSSLSLPMELEKGSTILLKNTSGGASIDLSGVVYYYEED